MAASNPRALSSAIALAISVSASTFHVPANAQIAAPKFKVIAFYTAKNDAAHISYVHEANRWFPKAAAENGFTYDSTNNWNNMNDAYLAQYQVVLFLDTRPEIAAQRDAFKRYMDKGGAFMGFHFAGFALNGSTYAQNWDWYHAQFLGAGEYQGNTWRPTSAVLRVEDNAHPATSGLPVTFKSQPNEWYSWKTDLKTKPDIRILLSIDPASFPLGTGPKAHEIWHSGYYPVVWTNRNYKMLYINMGHNDMDYGGTGKELSFTLANETQNKLILDGLMWLGGAQTVRARKTAPPGHRTGMHVEIGASRFTVSRPGVADFGISILDLQGNRIAEGRTATGIHSFDKLRTGRGNYILRSISASGNLIQPLSLP